MFFFGAELFQGGVEFCLEGFVVLLMFVIDAFEVVAFAFEVGHSLSYFGEFFVFGFVELDGAFELGEVVDFVLKVFNFLLEKLDHQSWLL